MSRLVRSQAKRIVGITLVVSLYFAAKLPQLADAERVELAAAFRFEESELPQVAGPEPRHVRPVHRDYRHIASWISSVGAAVALGELDGDGLPNDVVYVDVRTDQVIVAPAPGTPTRYEPFALAMPRDVFDRRTMAPMGCLIGDFNEDGLADILVYFWGRTPVAFLRRDQAAPGQLAAALGPDSYRPCPIGPEGERWFTNAATLADVDGDGHIDLVIGNYFSDGARVLDPDSGEPQTMHTSMSRAYNGGRNRLLLWSGAAGGEQPEVRFRQVDAWDDEVAGGWTLAVGAADLDGDLLPELYFANDFGHDRLLHNRSRPGKPEFVLLKGMRHITTPASKVLGNDSFKGMGVDFADLNGDGWLDLYVSNIAAEYALQESHFVFLSTGAPDSMRRGVAPYVDHGGPLGVSRSGWAWESRLGDFNNDGVHEALQATGFIKGRVNRWPELHEVAMGNDELLHDPHHWHRFLPGDDVSGSDPNPFFVRAADGRYYDVARQVGLDRPQVSRGIATADVDGDGRLDFAVANQWDTSRFYHNRSPKAGRFLGLVLLLPPRGVTFTAMSASAGRPETGLRARAAIGAVAEIRLPDGRRMVAEVDGGSGHTGQRSSDLHFGLGDVDDSARLAVTLRWRDPDGKTCRSELELAPGWHTILLHDSGRAQ
jgi:enediyne biosynthesis protein E4